MGVSRELDQVAEGREELARQLAEAHAQLVERDAELRRLRDVLVTLERDYRALAANFERIQDTRAWRAVVRYRGVKARILGG